MQETDKKTLDSFGDWHSMVESYLQERSQVVIRDIMKDVFRLEKYEMGEASRVSKLLVSLGYSPTGTSKEAKEGQRTYVLGDQTQEDTKKSGDGDFKSFRTELRDLAEVVSDRNGARFFLAVMCLMRLSQGGEWSRKELFGGSEFESGNKLFNREGQSKDWQRSFLSGLESDELVDKDDSSREHVYYETGDVHPIIVDAVKGDGRLLKKRLWPSLYEDEVEEKYVEETADGDDESLGVLSEVVAQLSATSESLLKVMETLTKMEERAAQREAAASQSMTDVVTRLEAILENLERREKADLEGLVARLDEIISRKKSLLNQLGSEDRREEKLMETVKTVLEGNINVSA